MTSLIQEDCNTHSQLKNKDIDYSDLNDLFQRTRTKTLQNDNFEDFLAIMQYFYLIPSNEIGNKMWGKIRKALNEANEKEGKFYF